MWHIHIWHKHIQKVIKKVIHGFSNFCTKIFLFCFFQTFFGILSTVGGKIKYTTYSNAIIHTLTTGHNYRPYYFTLNNDNLWAWCDCSTPCLLPGQAAEDGPEPWGLCTHVGDLKMLITSGFRSTHLRLLWPLKEWAGQWRSFLFVSPPPESDPPLQ